jgi:hypothetical protein
MERALLTMIALLLVVSVGGGGVGRSQTATKPAGNDVKIRQRISSGAGTGGAETLLYVGG